MASGDYIYNWGLGTRSLPALSSNNSYVPQRASLRGELYTLPLFGSRQHLLADEGSMFVATNPTPGTAIAGIAAADGLDDLEALVFLRHGGASLKRLYLLELELQVAAAGTNGTNFAYAIKLDKGASRRGTGGSAITPKNPNAADATASEIDALVFGAIVSTAATSEARLVDHGLQRTVIKVIGDKYRFVFGDSSPGPSSGIPLEGTTQGAITVSCPPVVLGAGDSFLFHEFATSQTVAAQYQFKMRWVER